jgi:hypothetical protein
MQDLLNYFIDLKSQREPITGSPETIIAHAKFLGLHATVIGDDKSLLRVSG